MWEAITRTINASMVSALLAQVFALLPSTMIKDFVEGLIEKATACILGSASIVDDRRILPIIKRLQAVLDANADNNAQAIATLIQFMLSELPELLFKELLDYLFDLIEDGVKDTGYAVLVDPLMIMVRAVLGVEDGIDHLEATDIDTDRPDIGKEFNKAGEI